MALAQCIEIDHQHAVTTREVGFDFIDGMRLASTGLAADHEHSGGVAGSKRGVVSQCPWKNLLPEDALVLERVQLVWVAVIGHRSVPF